MHAEYYHMSEETAALLNRVKENGGRIITVGTTSTRTLETIATDHSGNFCALQAGQIFLCIQDIEFKAIDGLITNFHLPKSTLIMLVSAFANRDNVLHAYNEAVKEKYRFFSFGDAMFVDLTLK